MGREYRPSAAAGAACSRLRSVTAAEPIGRCPRSGATCATSPERAVHAGLTLSQDATVAAGRATHGGLTVTVDRVYTPGLAQVAYLVADEAAGAVAVIDPRRDVDVYVDWASQRGFRTIAILETHVHADFVSGARELAAATGAPIYAGRLGEQDF